MLTHRPLFVLSATVAALACNKKPTGEPAVGSATPVAQSADAAAAAAPAWSATSRPIELACGDGPLTLTPPFFLEIVAMHFHVGTQTNALKIGGKSVGDSLFAFGSTKTGDGLYDNYRMNTEHLVDARNTVEQLKASGKSETDKDYVKANANYDALLKKDKGALDGKAKEPKGKDAPELDAYKQAVMEQVGKPFEQGKAVVIALFGHFTRLQGMTADELTIGDPGKWTTGQHRKVLWEEARAMGYFHHFLLLG